MTPLPQSKSGWIVLLLCPLKAWILLAWPVFVMARHFLYQPTVRWDFRMWAELLGHSYLLVGFLLLVGAAVQQRVCRQGHTWTLLWGLGGFMVFLVQHV